MPTTTTSLLYNVSRDGDHLGRRAIISKTPHPRFRIIITIYACIIENAVKGN